MPQNLQRFSFVRFSILLSVVGFVVVQWLSFVLSLAATLLASSLVWRVRNFKQIAILVCSIGLIFTSLILYAFDIHGIRQQKYHIKDGITTTYSIGKWDGVLRHRIMEFPEKHPSGYLWISQNFNRDGELHGKQITSYDYPRGKLDTQFFINGIPVSKVKWQSEIQNR